MDWHQLQEVIRNTNAGYTNAQNAANSWQGVNAQAQHDAHKVMMEMVRQRDAAVAAYNARGPAPAPSGGGGAPPPPPPPKPINPWITSSNYVAPKGVLQADPDIVITAGEEPISPELLLELQYEDISGMELINISRSDIIDGQNVIYSPIKNLSSLRRKYNPNNVIAMPAVSTSLFSKYPIDLILRVGENPETGLPYEPYFDDNGNLVIELQDVREDEIVEVEIDTSGTINLVDFT